MTTLDDLDRQAAESCLKAALDALKRGQTEDALHLTGDAAEAIGSLFVNEMARAPKARA